MSSVNWEEEEEEEEEKAQCESYDLSFIWCRMWIVAETASQIALRICSIEAGEEVGIACDFSEGGTRRWACVLAETCY